MLVICATDTYFDWTLIFLESLFITNGDQYKVSLSGLDLTKDMIDIFKNTYPNIDIYNKNINEKRIKKKLGISNEKYLKSKERLMGGYKTGNRWFSQYVLKYRVERLKEIIEKNLNEGWFISYDVDVLFRGDVSPLVNQVKENDICLRFKPGFLKRKNDHRIAGGVSGYSGEVGLSFVKKWYQMLNRRGLDKIMKDEGKISSLWDQECLYDTYDNFKDKDIKIGNIESKWITATYSAKKEIWGGHRKGRVLVQNDETKKRESVSCPNRTLLRNRVFVPELHRLRKINKENESLKWSKSIRSEIEFDKIREHQNAFLKESGKRKTNEEKKKKDSKK